MAIENGTDIIVSIGATPVAYATSGSITITQDLPDATTKDSGGWNESIAGAKSWSISGSGMIDFGASYGGSQIFNNLKNGDLVNVSFGKTGSGVWSGQARVANLSLTADVEVSATYDFEFTGVGTLTLT
jgi:TP901-1 family phage major tail protein